MGDKDNINTFEILVRLWTHECWRVFADRLINEADRQMLLAAVRETVRKVFGLNFDQVFARIDIDKDKEVKTLDEIRHLMFTDVLAPLGAPKRPYEEIVDEQKL